MLNRRYFIILGLFLAVGFLFLNASGTQAANYTWSGEGDGTTWTDPKNWGGFTIATEVPGLGYDAANDVVISTSTLGTVGTIYATSTLKAGIRALTISNGWTLVIGNNATVLASSTVAVTGTSTLKMGNATWGSGTLQLNMSGTDNQPLVISGTGATFTASTAATGTVMYVGTGGVNIASTTYYNLKLTPTSTATFRAGSDTDTANFTVSNVMTMGPSATLNGNGSTITLSGSGTPWVKTGGTATFTANGATVAYTSASATNIATGTYSTLSITGAITKTLVGNTSTNATGTVSIASGAILAISTYTFTTNDGTWTNAGTVTEGTGKISKASSAVFTDSSGTSKTSYDALTEGVYVTVTDTSLNLLAATAETQTVTVVSTSGFSDSESITLTETGIATGIFRGGLTFMLSGSDNSGVFDYLGAGSVSLAYTDSQDTSDTGSDAASFTGSSGGGGGGSSSASTAATTVTTTTTTTTTTPVPTTTITTPITTTVVAPTLESVQTKIASAVAAVAALSANPTASDLVSIQTQIAAILADIQAIQGTSQSVSQGSALGFIFSTGLGSGMTSADVRNLQTALKTDSSVYPEGLVTGYFGSMTLKAVQKFQEKYGIAGEGNAGYGFVGPKTRTKLNALYGGQ